MSLTIDITPAQFTFNTPYRPIFIKLTRTGGTDTLFRLEPLVHNAAIGNEITMDFTLGTDEWLFNLQDWLKNYVSFDLNPLGEATEFVEASNSMDVINYQGNSLPDAVDAITAHASRRFFILNATLQHLAEQNFTDYILDGSSYVQQFLTDSPYRASQSSAQYKGHPIKLEDSYYLGCLTTGDFTANTLFLTVNVTDKNDLITTSTIEIDTSSAFVHPYARFNLGVGCANLNAATLATGSQPVIDEDDRSYTLALHDSTPLIMSETYSFAIDQHCHNVERRFCWLNRLGGIDAFTFTANESRAVSNEHINFRKQLTYVPTQNTHNTYDFDVTGRGLTSLAVNSSEQVTTFSQILDDRERQWLEGLLSSQNVWTIETVNGVLTQVPVMLRDAEITMYDEEKNLFTFSFSFEYANETIIQEG